MKNNKLLITINKLDDISKLKELGINNYVFPLKDFCVGIPNTFLISEISADGYLLINRILDNEGIDKLKIIINSIPKNIKGIIFDDLGVLEIIKDINIEKIMYLNHFNTNSESVNIYFDYVDSIILPTDITKEEIKYIIEKANKQVSLFCFGYVPIMYSRRLLIDNYKKYYNIQSDNKIEIENDNNKFILFENEYGTVFYNNSIFNGYELLNLDAKYYFVSSTFLDVIDIKNFLNNKIEYLNADSGFLYKETIYKLKEEE